MMYERFFSIVMFKYVNAKRRTNFISVNRNLLLGKIL